MPMNKCGGDVSSATGDEVLQTMPWTNAAGRMECPFCKRAMLKKNWKRHVEQEHPNVATAAVCPVAYCGYTVYGGAKDWCEHVLDVHPYPLQPCASCPGTWFDCDSTRWRHEHDDHGASAIPPL